MNPPDSGPGHALELFRLRPDAFYTLDSTAHLAGVPRRLVMIYLRAGLVRAIFHPPYDLMVFTDESIHTIRRMEFLRSRHGLSIAWIKTVFDLQDQVEQLRAEVRFFRNR